MQKSRVDQSLVTSAPAVKTGTQNALFALKLSNWVGNRPWSLVSHAVAPLHCRWLCPVAEFRPDSGGLQAHTESLPTGSPDWATSGVEPDCVTGRGAGPAEPASFLRRCPYCPRLPLPSA